MNRVVIGVGNPTRGDDGAGAEVVRQLGMGTVVATPFQLMDLWEGADEAVVIDAARAGSPPGTIHRFEIGAQPLPTGVLATSTHSVGVVEVIELARALDRLPRRLLVYGIEVGDVDHGPGFTPEVEAAMSAVMAEVGRA